MRHLLMMLPAFMLLAAGQSYADSANVSTNPPKYENGSNNQSMTPSGGLRIQPQDGSGNDVSASHPLPVDATVSVTVGNITPAPATAAAGTSSTLTAGGTAVTIVTGPVNGCYIVNPLTLTDQGIASAEAAYVNPVTTATAAGNGNNSALQPGQAFSCVPGQVTNVSAIAATSGHRLNVVKW